MTSFFDTNVLLYRVEEFNPKRAVSERVLAGGGVVSVQVLNEFIDVARRKYKLDFDEIGDFLESFRNVCRVVDTDTAVHELGLKLARATNLRIYDACIVAAAELSGCDVLYTEDMNHSQRVGRVTIRNPFVAA